MRKNNICPICNFEHFYVRIAVDNFWQQLQYSCSRINFERKEMEHFSSMTLYKIKMELNQVLYLQCLLLTCANEPPSRDTVFIYGL